VCVERAHTVGEGGAQGEEDAKDEDLPSKAMSQRWSAGGWVSWAQRSSPGGRARGRCG
jgi:hypothetical protein